MFREPVWMVINYDYITGLKELFWFQVNPKAKGKMKLLSGVENTKPQTNHLKGTTTDEPWQTRRDGKECFPHEIP